MSRKSNAIKKGTINAIRRILLLSFIRFIVFLEFKIYSYLDLLSCP